MDQLFVATAKLMPEDTLLKELEKALENYMVLRTKDSKGKLEMFALMLVTRFSTEGDDLMKTIKMVEEAKAQSMLFKNKEQ